MDQDVDKTAASAKEAGLDRAERRRSKPQSEYASLSPEKTVFKKRPTSQKEPAENHGASSATRPAKREHVRSEKTSTQLPIELVFEKSAAPGKEPTDEATRPTGPIQPKSAPIENASLPSTKDSIIEEGAAIPEEPAHDQSAILPCEPARSEKPPLSLPKEVAFVTLICSAQLLTQAGLGQAISSLHIMAGTFGSPAPGQLSWFTAGYSLTIGTFIFVAGRLGDIFGHKLLSICGYSWLRCGH